MYFNHAHKGKGTQCRYANNRASEQSDHCLGNSGVVLPGLCRIVVGYPTYRFSNDAAQIVLVRIGTMFLYGMFVFVDQMEDRTITFLKVKLYFETFAQFDASTGLFRPTEQSNLKSSSQDLSPNKTSYNKLSDVFKR